MNNVHEVEIEYSSDLFCGNPLECIDTFKDYFSNLYNSLIIDFSSSLSKLKKVVISKTFIEDVIQFQIDNKFTQPQVTNNKYGRAFGKTIYIDSEDQFYIFLDGMLFSYLIDDNILISIKKNVTDNTFIDNIVNNRKLAINTLRHELAHVEMDSQYKYKIKSEFNVHSFTETLSSRLLEEYYACRRVSAFYDDISAHTQSNAKDIQTLEDDILLERKNYNYQKTDLNTFVRIINENILTGLIFAVSHCAHCFRNYDINDYRNLKMFCCIDRIVDELDKLYNKFMINTLPDYEILNKYVVKYFESFDVFLSDTPNGIYYDIPVIL